ncbi:MAG: hypothetical protein H6Q12_373 [Bacteroidetes bacterium]|nr:hypothetical protein [Bacteroidota bacterium]
MKRILLYLLPLLIFASCAKDDASGSGTIDNQESVKALFSLKVEGAGNPLTRSSSGIDNSTISNVWILQFTYTADGKGALMGTPQYLDMASDLDLNNIEAKLKAGNCNIYFVANTCNSGAFNSSNCSSEEAFRKLTKAFSSSSAMQTELVNATKLVTMTGLLPNVTVGADGNVNSTTKQTVNLERTLALVDLTYAVSFPTGVNFDVKSIRVCNVPNKMYYVKPTDPDLFSSTVAADYYDYPLEKTTTETKSGHLLFYLPDNLKGDGPGNLDPRNKSGITGKTCTYIEICGQTSDNRYGIFRYYLGNNDFQNYDVVRNNIYTISLTLKNLQTVDSRLSVYSMQPESNCYMVKTGQQILIPISRVNTAATKRGAGNIITPGTTAYTVGLLWAETNTGFNPNSIVEKVAISPSQDYITLKTGTAEGNAVIYAKVGNDIVWSWHIWVTGYEPDASPVASGATYYYNSRTWMDRNIGAKSTTVGTDSWGLLYQWGRKDPFPHAVGGGTSSQSAIYNDQGVAYTIGKGSPTNLITSIKNPGTYYGSVADTYNWDWLSPADASLWSGGDGTTPVDAKSVYDPCPPGWRVPSYAATLSPWNGLATTNGTFNGGWIWSTPGYYPAAGYIHESNSAYEDATTVGYYWTATTTSTAAYLMQINSTAITQSSRGKACALSVRCIKE